MNQQSNNNWYAMSDLRILQHIGAFVKSDRMSQHKTQAVLAKDAGISRSTLSLLERGETVTIATLVRVLRVLDKLDVMNTFVTHKPPSPLLLAQLEKGEQRKRVSSPKKPHSETVSASVAW